MLFPLYLVFGWSKNFARNQEWVCFPGNKLDLNLIHEQAVYHSNVLQLFSQIALQLWKTDCEMVMSARGTFCDLLSTKNFTFYFAVWKKIGHVCCLDKKRQNTFHGSQTTKPPQKLTNQKQNTVCLGLWRRVYTWNTRKSTQSQNFYKTCIYWDLGTTRTE